MLLAWPRTRYLALGETFLMGIGTSLHCTQSSCCMTTTVVNALPSSKTGILPHTSMGGMQEVIQ